jgi:hypothetical protein
MVRGYLWTGSQQDLALDRPHQSPPVPLHASNDGASDYSDSNVYVGTTTTTTGVVAVNGG